MEPNETTQEETTHNDAPTIEETPTENASVTEEEKGGTGALIGSVIILILVIVAGVFFWNTIAKKDTVEAPTDEVTEQEREEALADIATQDDSDDVDSIEADLEATSFNELDAELSEIDAEFE